MLVKRIVYLFRWRKWRRTYEESLCEIVHYGMNDFGYYLWHDFYIAPYVQWTGCTYGRVTYVSITMTHENILPKNCLVFCTFKRNEILSKLIHQYCQHFELKFFPKLFINMANILTQTLKKHLQTKNIFLKKLGFYPSSTSYLYHQ